MSRTATCRYCGATGLGWKALGTVGKPNWRLHQPDGTLHVCIGRAAGDAPPPRGSRHLYADKPGIVVPLDLPDWIKAAPPPEPPRVEFITPEPVKVAAPEPVAPPVITPTAPAAIPEPEALLSKAVLAAWSRADKAIRYAGLPMRVLLWGPPGTGKTELPWRIAQSLGWAHEYQLMTEETPATEMLGHLIVQAGSTVWKDGTLGRAIRASHNGHVVFVVDEIARASQDAMSACLLALTNPESLRLRSGDEVIAPKVEHWHVVATSNDEPSTLPAALADRLHVSIRLTHPHPDLVRTLTTVEARRLVTAESREYSVRAVLTYDRLRSQGWSLEDAARLVWEPEVAQSLIDVVKLGKK